MKRKYCLILFLALLSLGSCKKFLETTPSDFVNPNTYYTTVEQLNYVIAGVYNTLGTTGLYGSYAQYMLGFVGDEGHNDRNTLIGPHSYNIDATNSFSNVFWTDLYGGINRANVLIANVDKNPALDQSFRNQLRGEALFLRGFFYFQLVQYFGGVPLRITPSASVVDIHIPRASIKEVYDQILADMTAAEALVPGITTLKFGGRVSKSAVRGMLARVCLHMAGEPLKDVAKFADARNWAKKVMDDTEAGHDLNPSFPDVFIKLAADQYDIKESIFEAEFWGNRSDSFTESGNQGWINGPVVATTNTTTGRADGYMRINAKLYNVFEPGDNRKWWSISHFAYTTGAGLPNGSKSMSALPATEAAKYSPPYYPAKFRREYETLLPKHANTTPQNVPILRYADVLLMFAEAENEVNGPAGAVDALNRVRRRGWSTGVKSITVTSGGSGYTTAPTVTFSAGTGGATATGTAVISGGVVTAINLNRDLTGTTFFQEGKYASAPTITITGGGGSGATATAAIYLPADAEVKPADKASKEALRSFIRNERMRELNFEVSRKADLHRWGIFFQTMQDVGNDFRATVTTPKGQVLSQYFISATDTRYAFWPIPNNEVTRNTAIVQNPGW